MQRHSMFTEFSSLLFPNGNVSFTPLPMKFSGQFLWTNGDFQGKSKEQKVEKRLGSHIVR